MSVKKVKISELKQLPQDADASDIFMPAADSNNKTYRVPLSRYDNAKGEANTAAAAAFAAAQAANTAADNANAVSSSKLATIYSQGSVKSSGTDWFVPIVEWDYYNDDISETWNNILYGGNTKYYNGIAIPYAYCIKLTDICFSSALFDFCILPTLTTELGRQKAFHFMVVGDVTRDNHDFTDSSFWDGMIPGDIRSFTKEAPLSCWLCGRSVITVWRDIVGIMFLGDDGTEIWKRIDGAEYKLPVAASSVLGGIKASDTVKVDAGGTATVPVATTVQAGVVKPGDNMSVNNGVISVPLANEGEGTNAGVVSQGTIPFAGATPETIDDYGAIIWRNGHGVPRCVKLPMDTDLTSTAFMVSSYGVLWMLDGFYTNAWRTGTIKGFLVAANLSIVGFDTTEGGVWLKWGDSAWKQVSGGATVSDLLNNAEFLNKLAGILANETMRKTAEDVLADNFSIAYKELTTTEQGVVQESLDGTLTDAELPKAVNVLMKLFIGTFGAKLFGSSGMSPLNAE